MGKYLKLVLILLLVTGCSKSYYCDAGDTLKGTSCIAKNTTPANPVYTCKNHAGTYLSGDQCISNSFPSISFNADIESYNCYNGYLKGKECVIETTYNAYEK